MRFEYDLIVIGSGAGGGLGAHLVARNGKKVAVIEKGVIGGECPNFACVPTKALLHAADIYSQLQNADVFGLTAKDVSFDYRNVRKWKRVVVSRTGVTHGEDTFKEDGIDVIKGEAKFVSPHEVKVGSKRYTASKFLIATGSSVFVPPIPGLEDHGYITFNHAVDLDSLPDSIFILGGGPIGCEFTQIFQSFGVKVYLADSLPRLLSRDDEDVSNLVQALFENRGVHILSEIMVKKVTKSGDKKVIHFEKAGKEHTVSVGEIFIATGKRPNIFNLDLERAGVAFDKKGIKVNRYLQTSESHIYAAGDIVGPYLYTPTGSYQSEIAVHNMYSYKKRIPDYRVVPRCVFTSPEVAGVGPTENELIEKKIPYKKGITSIAAIGRANTSNEMDGFVKILTDKKGKILGASMVAPRAGEVIHEIAIAMKLGAYVDDIADMIHAYPTFSEAVKYACQAVE